MKKPIVAALLLAGFATLALAAVPTPVSAAGTGTRSGSNSNINVVICKSGKRVENVKKCKENGGKK